MATTGMNASMVLSIGIFFTLIIVGLSGYLPGALFHGLTAHGVPAAAASRVAHLPPTATVFAAFLGYNPIQNLLGPSGVLAHLTHAQSTFLTGRSFFPSLIAGPFSHGLHEALDFAIAACLVAAGASALMGKQYFYQAPAEPAEVGPDRADRTDMEETVPAEPNGNGSVGKTLGTPVGATIGTTNGYGDGPEQSGECLPADRPVWSSSIPSPANRGSVVVDTLVIVDRVRIRATRPGVC